MGFVECVPNFSEGRDQQKIDAIASAIREADPAILLLSVEPDPDYNRTVVTFAGPAQAVLEGAFAGIQAAKEEIDMRSHKGEHPRLGATDVCPFVPLKESSMEECAQLAETLARRVGEELGIPTYLYGEAATSPERRLLSSIRKGEYESLKEKLADEDWQPDFGPAEFSASIQRSGATVIGARNFLIAYNVDLRADEVKIAKMIASRIRTSGRKVRQPDGELKRVPGTLEEIQALGVDVDEPGVVQVSINLLDFRVTGLYEVYEEVKRFAAKFGAEVTGSEIVGLVPLESVLDAGRAFRGEDASHEVLIIAAVEGLGLSDRQLFSPQEKIIELYMEERMEAAQ